MKRTYIIAGSVLLIVFFGFGGWYIANSLEKERTYADASQGCTTHPEESVGMFASMTGEEFDETFIADMLLHHEGAVNMAERALVATDRPEIGSLATAIIEAQSKEIAQMQAWQKEWGYSVTTAQGHADHGGSLETMGDGMMAMTESLDGLDGEVFDQRFLELMIEHHQQAVDMARYAETNAFHAEIQELGKAIISAQETEIAAMKEWQESWGFPVSESKSPTASTRCEL